MTEFRPDFFLVRTHSRLQINQYRPRYIMLIIRLVKEYILPIPLPAVRCPVFERAVGGDTVFLAEFLPKLRPNYSVSVLIVHLV